MITSPYLFSSGPRCLMSVPPSKPRGRFCHLDYEPSASFRFNMHRQLSSPAYLRGNPSPQPPPGQQEAVPAIMAMAAIAGSADRRFCGPRLFPGHQTSRAVIVSPCQSCGPKPGGANRALWPDHWPD